MQLCVSTSVFYISRLLNCRKHIALSITDERVCVCATGSIPEFWKSSAKWKSAAGLMSWTSNCNSFWIVPSIHVQTNSYCVITQQLARIKRAHEKCNVRAIQSA